MSSVESYRKQRDVIPAKELARHAGKWAAFSRDGDRVVASCENLEGLEKAIRAAGEDPQSLVYEFIQVDEMTVTGAELQ